MFGNRGPKRRGPKPRARKSDFEAQHEPSGIFETVIGAVVGKRGPETADGPVGPARPDQRAHLVDLAIEPLSLLHAAFCKTAPIDPARLREQWKALRAAFEAAGREQGHREADVKAAVYALSVALDEAVMSHPEQIGLWLQAGALQLEFHENRDLIGGQRFFQKLDELRASREASIEGIEVYDACLALGYRGRFVADPAGREALRASLLTDLGAVRGQAGGPLAPHVRRIDEQVGETVTQLPSWVPPVVLAGAVLLSWLTVVLITLLHARGVAGALSRMAP